MKYTNIKGALLEYIIRNLLKECGFINVNADNLYSFERGGLFFVNGKGAAHDADVIMNPPIQIPFTYPVQLIFECKGYGSKVNLPIVRNALGLRNDLNNFEIITKSSLKKRQNNRRSSYAVETRNRFIYQVGVASINDFSKTAIEFATNNKIPLLSLSWFLGEKIISDINKINQTLIDGIQEEMIDNLYNYFKDRNGNIYDDKYYSARKLIEDDNPLGDIITFSNAFIKNFLIGIIETGDIIFLYSSGDKNELNNYFEKGRVTAEIHYNTENRKLWSLTIYSQNDIQNKIEYEFYIPDRIMSDWREYNYSRFRALIIKEDFFSKIYILNKIDSLNPLFIININKKWLDEANEKLRDKENNRNEEIEDYENLDNEE